MKAPRSNPRRGRTEDTETRKRWGEEKFQTSTSATEDQRSGAACTVIPPRLAVRWRKEQGDFVKCRAWANYLEWKIGARRNIGRHFRTLDFRLAPEFHLTAQPSRDRGYAASTRRDGAALPASGSCARLTNPYTSGYVQRRCACMFRGRHAHAAHALRLRLAEPAGMPRRLRSLGGRGTRFAVLPCGTGRACRAGRGHRAVPGALRGCRTRFAVTLRVLRSPCVLRGHSCATSLRVRAFAVAPCGTGGSAAPARVAGRALRVLRRPCSVRGSRHARFAVTVRSPGTLCGRRTRLGNGRACARAGTGGPAARAWSPGAASQRVRALRLACVFCGWLACFVVGLRAVWALWVLCHTRDVWVEDRL
jgi:hypothetical protein